MLNIFHANTECSASRRQAGENASSPGRWKLTESVTPGRRPLVFRGPQDRTRWLTCDILLCSDAFPRPLPGYAGSEDVRKLITWALGQTASPRARQADAGALILRLVWRVYCCELGWSIAVDPKSEAVTVAEGVRESAASSGAAFVDTLLDVLERRLDETKAMYEVVVRGGTIDIGLDDDRRLGHGILTLLRFVIEDLGLAKARSAKQAVIVDGVDKAGWPARIERILLATRRAIDIALLVVGEAEVSANVAEGESDAYGTTAPVQANRNSRVTLAVDCRGHAVVATATELDKQVRKPAAAISLWRRATRRGTLSLRSWWRVSDFTAYYSEAPPPLIDHKVRIICRCHQ